MDSKLLKWVEISTVGDLLDALAEVAKDPELSSALDASVESGADTFTKFKIVRRTLSDKSEVLDFELYW